MSRPRTAVAAGLASLKDPDVPMPRHFNEFALRFAVGRYDAFSARRATKSATRLTARERLTMTEFSHRAPHERQRMSRRSQRDRRSIRRNRPPVEHDGERSYQRDVAAGVDDAEESLAVERGLIIDRAASGGEGNVSEQHLR